MTGRRTATLLLAGVLVVLLLAVAWLVPVPYVTMGPGPTENTLGSVGGKPIVDVDHRTYPTRGAIDLTTVSVTSPDQRLPLLGALGGWADPHVAVVPRTYIYPENTTPQQVEQRNVEEMQGSQQTAVAAAERELGLPVSSHVDVRAVVAGTPADGRLKAADQVRAVDGHRVRSPQDVVDLVGRHRPGDTVGFTVRRHGRTVRLELTTTKSTEDPDKAMVGIQVGEGYDVAIPVSVRLGEQIGGPSAGTMFALAIVDKLTPGALTGGRHVAGTGTIGAGGDVGPIGGIQQKIAGARAGGATVFLTPAANCREAAAAGVDGIRLVRISTLHGAVRALKALAGGSADGPGGGAVPGCGD